MSIDIKYLRYIWFLSTFSNLWSLKQCKRLCCIFKDSYSKTILQYFLSEMSSNPEVLKKNEEQEQWQSVEWPILGCL